MSSPFIKRSNVQSWWVNYYPLPVFLITLFLEHQVPSLRITTSLLLIALAGFSLILSPRVILLWTLIYGLPVALSVASLAEVVALPMGAAALRIVAFICAGIMASLISAYRLRLAAEVNNYLKLFDALPIPLVVSDVDGEIQFANEASCLLLQRSFEEVTSLNYFSLFSDSHNRGQEITRYLELFDNENVPTNVMLVIQTSGGKLQRLAACFLVKIQGRPYLVTQMGTIVV